jgi:lipid-binding SYLF domain-containing protein
MRRLAAPLIVAVLVANLAIVAAPRALAQQEATPTPLTPEEKEAERQARLKIANDGLAKLYAVQPDARAAIEKAVGYAVFDVTSTYAILFVGQRGAGVMFDNATKAPTFMHSLRAGTGPGIGRQRVYQIFVFKSKEAMEQFVVAGGTGGDVSASISTGRDGTVRSFNPTIDIFQVPESGMALQASWGGTVYSVDEQLR